MMRRKYFLSSLISNSALFCQGECGSVVCSLHHLLQLWVANHRLYRNCSEHHKHLLYCSPHRVYFDNYKNLCTCHPMHTLLVCNHCVWIISWFEIRISQLCLSSSKPLKNRSWFRWDTPILLWPKPLSFMGWIVSWICQGGSRFWDVAWWNRFIMCWWY